MSNSPILTTKAWVKQIVIGCNFCPFAGKPFKDERIHYTIVESKSPEEQLASVLLELQQLNEREDVETTLIIFPEQFSDFLSYLDFVDLAEGLLVAHDYEGVYQIASFHPKYIFAGSNEQDPANYTNRSPYPMVHLLREGSLSKAIDQFPDVEGIPERNMAFAREKGLEGMQQLFNKNED
ncbi:MAG: DUF1415 domain-containing protein [Saprospiraceae bacterium]